MPTAVPSRAEALARSQAQILERIATGAPLDDVLELLTRSIEERAPGMLCSVLVMDSDGVHLHHGAAPSLPPDYNRAIEGIAIGPAVGSCGTAAYRRAPVIVADIATDPLWADFRDLALAHGLRACWSTPIISTTGAILGTFAMYYRAPGTPTEEHRELIALATHLAGIAIERERADEARSQVIRAQIARAEAERAEERLRDLFMQAPAAICVVRGPRHVIELANARYRELVGRHDLVGKPVAAAFPELGEQGFIEQLDRVYESGEAFVGTEVRIRLDRRGDGRLEDAYFNVVYQPIRGPAGRIEGIFLQAVEVTELFESRAQIQQLATRVVYQRDRLRQVLDVLPEAVLVADADGRAVIANAAARDIIGETVPDADVHGHAAAYQLRHLDDTPYPPDEAPLVRSLLRGEVVRGEQVLIRNAQTGRDVPILVNSAPLGDAAGGIDGGVMVFQDISALQDLEREKSAFLGAVSHDLKNPLAAVKGVAQILTRRVERSEEIDRARLLEGLRSIDTATGRMTALVGQLLDLTHLEMGRPLDLERQPTDLIALLQNIVADHQQATEIHRIRFAADADSLIGTWDAARLERVFGNLLANAVQYSPAGGEIAVTASRADGAAAGWAIVRVRDQGIGIPPGECERIFDRFYRGSNAAEIASGTGIGLAGARQIVVQHGGTLVVESEVGKGSTFVVELPL